MGMGMMGGGGGPQMFDASAAFKAERELLSITKYDYKGDAAEKSLLGDRYPQVKTKEIDLSK
jgi:hypothetical protein